MEEEEGESNTAFYCIGRVKEYVNVCFYFNLWSFYSSFFLCVVFFVELLIFSLRLSEK